VGKAVWERQSGKGRVREAKWERQGRSRMREAEWERQIAGVRVGEAE
jgi:hypothetical protein